MVSVSFEEVTCRGLPDTNNRYRLVLFASETRKGELRSAYRHGSDVFGWKSPFKNPVVFEGSTAPLHVVIQLREKGWPGMAGRNVCSYTLNLDRNHASRTFELDATESDIQPTPQLSLTASVAGITTNDSEPVPQNDQDSIHAQPPVAPGTFERELSASLPNPPPVEPIEFPTSHLPSSPTIPVLQFSTSDDPEPEASSSPDGPEERSQDLTRGLSKSKRRPSLTASHVDSSQLLSAESAARNAKTEQSSIRQRATSVTDSISTVEPVASAAVGLGEAMYSGVSRLDAVVQIVDVAANIHPLVKGVWSLLNVAYTLAKQQSDLDLKVGDLVDALDANCELARVLTEDQIAGVAETIVAKILREVLNGADVIKEYCIVRKSKMSAFKFAGSTTAIRVETCLQTLEVFRRNLAEHVAANVHRDLHGLQTLALTLEIDLKAVKAQIDQVSRYVKNQEDDALLNQMPFAPEADRAMRSDERGCLPGTRAEIIEAIVHWAIGADVGPSQAYVRGLNPDSQVLWLCGVAGSGKSSIAISVAKVLRSMGRLGAIYGFETAFQTSLNSTNLFSTIARQRAEQQSGRKRHLLTTLNSINRDQRATVSASEQFKSFLSVSTIADPSILNDVVVIDAFDESGSVSKRAAALLTLSPESRTSTFPSDVRFIVTSRYDPDVAKRLESVCVGDEPKVSVIQMEDIYHPHTERDITLYIAFMLQDTDGLDAHRVAGNLAQLAIAAEHSFQWASAACRFIADSGDHDASRLPADRLNEILATRSGLDTLYISILDHHFASGIDNPTPATQSLRYILGSLVCALEPLSVHMISSIASAEPSYKTVDIASFHLLARKLAAILFGTKGRSTPLVAFHTSFTDFLADAQRSKQYAVAAAEMHLHLAMGSLAMMKQSLQFNICHLESSFLRNNQVVDLPERIKRCISSELSYACRFWPVHVAAALSSDSSDTEPLRQSLSDFLKNKLLLLQWLEVMSLTATDAYASLGPLSSLQTDNRDLSDLFLFTTYFSVPIGLTVPHIYLSALAFAPTSSLITVPTSTHFPNLVHSDAPLASWPRVRHKLEHPSGVKCVAFSPGGGMLVSGERSKESRDLGGALVLWDAFSGTEILPRIPTPSACLSIAFSPDGSLLASGHEDGTIQLWETRTMAARGRPLSVHTDRVRSVAFSPDNSRLASGADDKTIRLWDPSDGSPIGQPLIGHKDGVLAVVFSPNGSLLASGSRDHSARIWDVCTLSSVGLPLEEHSDWVWCVAFSPDGTLLVTGAADETIRLWDAHTWSTAGEPLEGHSDQVRSVDFSPDGKTLASCSCDKTVRMWDTETRSVVGEPLAGHSDYVVSIAFSPDGSLLASGSFDKTVHIWDARVLTSNGESPAARFKIADFAAFSPDGKLLASGSDDNMIQLWDVHSVSPVGEPLKGHTNNIKCVAFSPDSTLLASGSDDTTVRLWDVRTNLAVGEPLRGHFGSVLKIVFSPDGKLLASGSDDRTIRFWDKHARASLGQPLAGFPTSSVDSFMFAPDSLTLASEFITRTVQLWDVQTRSPIGEALEGHSAWIQCVAFSPDGTLLASASNDGTVRLWNVRTQSSAGEPLIGHAHSASSLAFSPDGALLVSSSSSKDVVLVWNVRVPSEVGESVALLRHESNVCSIAFVSAAPILASITSGGVVRKWDLQYLLSTRAPNVYCPEGHSKKQSLLLLPDHPNLAGLPPNFIEVLDDGWVLGPVRVQRTDDLRIRSSSSRTY